MTGIYFSGTGNTKHCIEKLLGELDDSAEAVPLESDRAVAEIKNNGVIIFGYPTQFSNAPYFVRDFIRRNEFLWAGKKILCVATMGAFSGDGAGCSARLLKKYGAEILGGLHLKMPDSVCDVKFLKKTVARNRKIVIQADRKIEFTAKKIRQGKFPQDGLNFFSHLAGLLGQRLWFYKKTAGYSDGLKISGKCTGCGLCASLCPVKNIVIQDGKAQSGHKCTMCYRCISRCPQKAVTLIGREVTEQCQYEKYR